MSEHGMMMLQLQGFEKLKLSEMCAMILVTWYRLYSGQVQWAGLDRSKAKGNNWELHALQSPVTGTQSGLQIAIINASSPRDRGSVVHLVLKMLFFGL